MGSGGTNIHRSRAGRDIIQIVGDGNTVIAGYPHLTITRYLKRRRQVSSEIDLLNPYAMTIPLVGRASETAAFHQWLTKDTPISVRVLIARAGGGKTRLALVWCDRLADEGWDAGFIEPRELDRFLKQQNLSQWGWQHPTLLVVDYAATQAQVLKDWFQELADHDGPVGKPLRILLLERHADTSMGWWPEAFGLGGWGAHAVQGLLDPPEPVPLPPLAGPEHRQAILIATLEKTSTAVRPPSLDTDPEFQGRLAQLEWGGEPLFLMMAALLATREKFGRVLALNRTDLAMELANRERARVERFADARQLHAGFLSHMVALSTLYRGLDRPTCLAVAEEEKAFLGLPSAGDPADLADVLHEVLPGQDCFIEPVLPDMIGEAFVLRSLIQQDEQGATTIARAFQRQPQPVAAVVIRTAQDYGVAGYQQPLIWLSRLIEDEDVALDALYRIANELPPSSLVLTDYAVRIHKLLAGQLRPLAAQRPDAFRPDLASALNNLANRLSALGQREAALDAAQQAADLYRELAAQRPDAFRPNLALSISVMSDILAMFDRPGDAAQAAHEALEILAPFVEHYPKTYGSLARTIGADVLQYSQAAAQVPDKELLQRVARALSIADERIK